MLSFYVEEKVMGIYQQPTDKHGKGKEMIEELTKEKLLKQSVEATKKNKDYIKQLCKIALHEENYPQLLFWLSDLIELQTNDREDFKSMELFRLKD